MLLPHSRLKGKQFRMGRRLGGTKEGQICLNKRIVSITTHGLDGNHENCKIVNGGKESMRGKTGRIERFW